MFKSTFWDQFVGSIIKTERYEEFIQRPAGKAVLYLLLLTFIVTLLYGIKVAFIWNNVVNTMADSFADKAPDFLFADGVLEVKAPMPYVAYDNKDVLIIVDTTGKTDETILRHYKQGIFIGKDKIVDKQNEVETRSYDLSEFQGVTLTKATVTEYIPWLKGFNILIVLFIFIYEFFANLTAALVLSLGGWLASQVISYRIMFTDLYKISIYALTLPLLIELAQELAGVGLPYFRVSFYAIGLMYVVMALLLLKKKNGNGSQTPVLR